MTTPTHSGSVQGLEWLTTDADGLPWFTAMDVPGQAADTLDALTLAATGTVAVAGASSITLDALTLASVGTVPALGVLATTFADLTVAGVGVVVTHGSLNVTLDLLAGSGGAASAVVGIGSITLDPLTLLAHDPPAVVVPGDKGGRRGKHGRRVGTTSKTIPRRRVLLPPITGRGAITFESARLDAFAGVSVSAQAHTSLSGLHSRSAGRVRVSVRDSVVALGGLTVAGELTKDWSGAIADDDVFLLSVG